MLTSIGLALARRAGVRHAGHAVILRELIDGVTGRWSAEPGNVNSRMRR